MKTKYDPELHGEEPPLTDEMLAKMRPSREVHGKEWVERKVAARTGRPPLPPEERKVTVSIRLSPEVVKFFKAGGKGWHTRIDEALRKEAGI